VTKNFFKNVNARYFKGPPNYRLLARFSLAQDRFKKILCLIVHSVLQRSRIHYLSNASRTLTQHLFSSKVMRFFNLLEITVLAIAAGTKQVSAQQCNISAVIDVPSERTVEYSTVTDVGKVKTGKKGRAKSPKSSSGKKRGKVDLTNFSPDCDDAAEITLELPNLFSTTFTMDKRKKKPPRTSKDESAASAVPTSNNIFLSGEDEDGSAINLLRKPNGNIVGSVTDLVHNTVMQIGEDINGDTVIDIIPTSEFPPEAEPNDLYAIKDKSGEKKKRLLFDTTHDPNVSRRVNTGDVTIIDVLVVWTRYAECMKATGSRDCTVNDNTKDIMDTLIELAINESNKAYEMSGVGIKLELVHSYRGEFTEPSTNAFNVALSQLRSKTDGVLDEVHSKRITFGADVVAMLIDDPTYCGLGKNNKITNFLFGSMLFLIPTLQNLTPILSFASLHQKGYTGPGESLMFSVTKYSCAIGYYSFAHEIGE